MRCSNGRNRSSRSLPTEAGTGKTVQVRLAMDLVSLFELLNRGPFRDVRDLERAFAQRLILLDAIDR